MEYQLKRLARSRSIRISLDSNHRVVVTAPLKTPVGLIDDFVAKSEAWIKRYKQKLSLRQMANPTLNFEEKTVSYLGRLYAYEFSGQGAEKVQLSGSKMLVAPPTFAALDVDKTLVAWLKTEAERLIRKQVAVWSEKMQTDCRSIRFGQQKSRWGSCTGDNRLQFNWRLVHFPLPVIDYVIIHELAHTVHHNHSAEFWQLVAKHCPAFKEHKLYLKRQMVALV
jgi:predicted metal-dependent hydrolase